MVDRPIFVIGCGRSGTTLLFQLMRRHPQVAPTIGYPDGEDHVGWNLHGNCFISGLGHADKDAGHTGYHYCLHMDESDVDPDVVARMTRYYHEEVQRGDVRKRALNKCGHISNKLRYVRAIFPDARFVHIVRDALPVIASWKLIMEEQTGQVLYWPDTPYPCFWVMPAPNRGDRARVFRNETRVYPGAGEGILVDYWCATNRNIPIQMSDCLDQLLTVRYEDLCANPSAELRRIFSFCELDDIEPDTQDDYGREVGSRNQKFEATLSEEQVARYLERAEDVRRQFGYL